MNVTAATLFPDLMGLARSLLTLPIRREKVLLADPPWKKASKKARAKKTTGKKR